MLLVYLSNFYLPVILQITVCKINFDLGRDLVVEFKPPAAHRRPQQQPVPQSHHHCFRAHRHHHIMPRSPCPVLVRPLAPADPKYSNPRSSPSSTRCDGNATRCADSHEFSRSTRCCLLSLVNKNISNGGTRAPSSTARRIPACSRSASRSPIPVNSHPRFKLRDFFL